MSAYHEPVLLNECLEGLAIKPEGIYVDVTFGGGSHSRAILSQLTTGKLFSFDQDEDAIANSPEDERFHFIQGNFRHLKRLLRVAGIKKVDGLLGDLGISWHQINTPDRGFSTRFDDAVLDMRMNKDRGDDAKDILNTANIVELTRIFKEYGELTNAAKIAAAILTERSIKPIRTTGDLLRIVSPFQYGKRPQFFARLFQALRIEANEEMEALGEMLMQTIDLIKPEGRLVIISYHSLEDRMVKNFMKKGSLDGSEDKDFYGKVSRPFKPINKKVIVPTEKELKMNPKSRSAKLRVAQRLVEEK